MTDRSAKVITPADRYTITSYPLYMAEVTPSDTTDLAQPGFIRADAAGAVTFLPQGETNDATTVTINLVAGEVIPVMVRRVLDTGTDSITLHVCY